MFISDNKCIICASYADHYRVSLGSYSLGGISSSNLHNLFPINGRVNEKKSKSQSFDRRWGITIITAIVGFMSGSLSLGVIVGVVLDKISSLDTGVKN